MNISNCRSFHGLLMAHASVRIKFCFRTAVSHHRSARYFHAPRFPSALVCKEASDTIWYVQNALFPHCRPYYNIFLVIHRRCDFINERTVPWAASTFPVCFLVLQHSPPRKDWEILVAKFSWNALRPRSYRQTMTLCFGCAFPQFIYIYMYKHIGKYRKCNIRVPILLPFNHTLEIVPLILTILPSDMVKFR